MLHAIVKLFYWSFLWRCVSRVDITRIDVWIAMEWSTTYSWKRTKQAGCGTLLWCWRDKEIFAGKQFRYVFISFCIFLGLESVTLHCVLNLTDLVVRSHEVKDEGYEIEHDGKLITVFSAPNYCDQVTSRWFLFYLLQMITTTIYSLKVQYHN